MNDPKELQTALGEILDRAIDATAADFGNIQLRSPDGSLRIAVHRGFDRDFLQFFRVVKNDKTVCASALKDGRRVVVRDVRRSAKFTESTRRELLKAGVLAVQSTPVRLQDGRIVAMVSTHFRRRHTPTRTQLARIDRLVREAADLIGREAAALALDVRQTIEDFRDSAGAKARVVRGKSS